LGAKNFVLSWVTHRQMRCYRYMEAVFTVRLTLYPIGLKKLALQ